MEEDGTLSPAGNVNSEEIVSETEEFPSAGPSTSTSTRSNTPSSSISQKRKRNDELDSVMSTYLKNKMARAQEKSDKNKSDNAIQSSLDSLVPDMMQLTPENLRVYKIEMLNTLHNLLTNTQ